MPTWTELGLPCATVDNYGYGLDAGLVRTKMSTGYSMQRRKWTTQPTEFTLSWLVNSADLKALTDGINAYAYTWIEMPLITGVNGSDVLVNHTVRMMSDQTVVPAGKYSYKVSIKAEATTSGAQEAPVNPANVLHSQLNDIQINQTHAQIDTGMTTLATRADTTDTEQAAQDARLDGIDSGQAIQNVRLDSLELHPPRIDNPHQVTASQAGAPTLSAFATLQSEVDTLEQVKSDKQWVADNFVVAAYISKSSGNNIAFPDLDATWQDMDFITTVGVTPRGIVDQPNGQFSFSYPGVFSMSISGSMEHDSSNNGRTFSVRLINFADSTPGNGIVVGTGRNQDATTIVASGMFEITAANLDENYGFQIGGGDTYTAVNFQTISYFLMSVGLWEGAL